MEFQYKAFISYRHVPRDSAAAKAIHTAVERYVIPKKLRKDGKKHPGRVFRDEEELSISEDLSEDICEALDQSEFLIVVCSPQTLDSKWVPREIAYFREHRDPENILTVLTGGDPDGIFRTLMPGMPEPLFLDLSGSPTRSIARELKEQFLKLCAPLLGCRYDDLVRRDEKRRRRQMFGWMGGVAAVAAVIIGILSWSNWQIEGKNAELEQKNEQLKQQNTDLLLRESEILTNESIELLEEGYQTAAIQNALAALPSPEEDRPYYAAAEQALWSALGSLIFEGQNLIPQDTILSQSTIIEDYCINADGGLLTTVDSSSLLTCFDTVTGDQIWTRKLIHEDIYNSIHIDACPLWNSVIVFCGDMIFAVAQDTGEMLWSYENSNVYSDWIIADDGRHIAILTEIYPDGIHLIDISTQDGTVLNTYPVTNGSEDRRLLHSNLCDLSSDGRLFAGCFYETASDDSNILHYFVTDLDDGTTTGILKQTVKSGYGSVHVLSFTDQDTTLTLVRDSGDISVAATVEKISIQDRTLIWRSNTPEPEDKLNFFYSFGDGHCVFLDGYILLGSQRFLYAIDPGTGEVLATKPLDSPLIQLGSLGTDYYTLTLADGTYGAGWLNAHGLFTSPQFTKQSALPLMQLGPLQKNHLWKDGYLRINHGENGLELYIDSVEAGFGYTAAIPEGAAFSVIIRRMTAFEPVLNPKLLYTGKDAGSPSLTICGEDTLAWILDYDSISDPYSSYLLFDRATGAEKGSFEISEEISPTYLKRFPLADRVGLLFESGSYDTMIFDTTDQSLTTLVEQYGPIHIDGEDGSVLSRVFGTASVRLSDRQGVLTVAAAEHGIVMWLNGRELTSSRYPFELDRAEDDYDMQRLLSFGLIPGANGLVLLNPLQKTSSPILDSYFLYSIVEDRWCSIPFRPEEAVKQIVCLGQTSPIFTVMASNGVIRVFDIPSGIQKLEINTGLSANGVEQITWIMEDRYLVICTTDGNLLFLDSSSGEIIHQLQLDPYNFWSSPSFSTDPQGKRLYIWDNNIGLCLDTESWTTLVEIPDICLYDPATDLIYYTEHLFTAEEALPQLFAYRLPSTDELVSIGRQVLGE